MIDQPQIIPVGKEPLPLRRVAEARSAPPWSHHRREPGAGKTRWNRTGGRFRVLNAFVDLSIAGLTRNEIAVWLILYRDTREDVARTSQADMARRAGVSDRTIRRVIRTLEHRGLLKILRRGGIGRGPSAYQVRPVAPADGGHACPVVSGQPTLVTADRAASCIP